MKCAQHNFENLTSSVTATLLQIFEHLLASDTCSGRRESHYSIELQLSFRAEGNTFHPCHWTLDRGLYHSQLHCSPRLAKHPIDVHVFNPPSSQLAPHLLWPVPVHGVHHVVLMQGRMIQNIMLQECLDTCSARGAFQISRAPFNALLFSSSK